MFTTVTLEEAQAHLKELIEGLPAGGELVITDNQRPIAKLVGTQPRPTQTRPGPGLCKGTIVYMAPEDRDQG